MTHATRKVAAMLLPDGLHPAIAPHATHSLAVDPPHVLHVEESGNPAGIPVVFLHGGPGAGFRPAARRSFDPKRFRLVAFDQRGCGRSTPSASLDGNTTQALIADIERIRAHLGIERWLVTGGSWGSFLALAYAQAHPERCLGLRLHGIFLGSAEGIRFWFHGIGRLFPEAFEAFAGHVPAEERGDLLAAYYRHLTDPDPAVHLPAAVALRGFSARTQTLLPSAAHLAALTEPRAALEISRLFTHYCTHGCFMPEGALLEGIDRIRHLPCEIVHGRYDVVTPMDGAFALHRAWPEARLTVVDLANHVATPEAPALSAALVEATDRLADRLDGAGPRMADYIALRGHAAPALSEDGGCLAWIADETGLDQLWSMDLAGGRPARRVAMPEKVYAVAFRPKSRDILFTTDRGGDERLQLWLIRDGAAEPEALTDDPRFVHQWGCFDPAGTRIAFASNARDARHMDIHVRDLDGGATRCVLTGEGWRTPMRFSPDGRTLIVQDNRLGMFDAGLVAVDLDGGGAPRVLLAPGQHAHIAAVRFAAQGAELMLVTDARRAFHGLARMPASGGTIEWLATPEGDVELAALSKDEGTAALAVNVEGYTRLMLHDLASGTSREIGGLPPGRVTGLLFAAGDRALIVALARFDRPSALWRIDLASGRAEVLAAGAFPLAEADVVRPATVAIPTFDGRSVPAFLFEPREPRPGRPALVIVHGGPESQYAAHWRSDVQFLVRRGWTVVAPNVRGSTGYGRPWQAADDREKRMDSVRDLKAVRDWTAALPGVDPARLVVAGQSYGGFMVLAALTEYPDDWCAGAEFYGIADFNTLLATTGPWRRALRAVEYGDPDSPEGRAMLADFSPLAKLDRLRVPLFIAHGGDDPRVPPGESEMVYSNLRGRGHPATLLRIPYEGHGFARIENRRTVYDALARFLFESAGSA